MTEEVKKEAEDKTPEPKVEEPQYTETEQKALDTGWVPKDLWKGAEEDWVPAKAYLKYGEVESELKKTRSEASQKEKVIKSMKDYYLSVKEDAKKEILDTLKRHKKAAIKAEDYVEVAKIDAQLEEITDNLERKFKVHDEGVKKVETQVGPPPAFYEWNRKNSWYVLGATDGLTKEADVLAIAYAQQHPNAQYEDVLSYVGQTIRTLHPTKFEPSPRSKPADVNEPGEAVGDGRSSKKSKLSPAEKEAAKAFGLSEEEYAKGLKQWDKMKGVE